MAATYPPIGALPGGPGVPMMPTTGRLEAGRPSVLHVPCAPERSPEERIRDDVGRVPGDLEDAVLTVSDAVREYTASLYALENTLQPVLRPKPNEVPVAAAAPHEGKSAAAIRLHSLATEIRRLTKDLSELNDRASI